MRCSTVVRIGLALGFAVAFVAASHAQAPARTQKTGKTSKAGAVPKTPWGDPDLQGIWNNDTTTPLERPDELSGKEALNDEEAETRDDATLERTNRDRRDGAGTDADVARAYNDFWWEYGKSDGRTSLIVDPPDGRIPSMTEEARRRADAGAANRGRLPGGPEDLPLYTRCITRGIPTLPGAYNNNFQIVQSPAT